MSTEPREYIIVGQDQGVSFTLWDAAPAPTNGAKRAIALEEIGVEAMDACGQVHTEWAVSARAAVDQLLATMRAATGFDDYGLSPDSNLEAYGPAGDITPGDSTYGNAESASAAGCNPFDVEASSVPGVPSFAVHGLPDRTVNETRDRVRAATVNSGRAWPQSALLVTIVTAGDTRVLTGNRASTSSLDLAIACTVLAAAGQLSHTSLTGAALIGELGLDGGVVVPNGLGDLAQAAEAAGHRCLIVPDAGVDEARAVTRATVLGVSSLNEAVALLAGHHHHPAGCLHCTDTATPHRPCTGQRPCDDCGQDAEPVTA